MFESFGIQRFVARWLAALLLVLATYNPSGYSYYHWITELEAGDWTLKLLVGVVLAILYATFGLATQRSLGRLGIAAWLLFFAVVTWMMIDLGLLRIAGSGTVATIVLVNLANLMAVGVSWSYVRARLSGQADTNNVTLP
jgi:tetrahydromethanopterin S-methyltransferase subunit E